MVNRPVPVADRGVGLGRALVDRVAGAGVVGGAVAIPWVPVVGRGIVGRSGTVGRSWCAHDRTAVHVAAHVHLLLGVVGAPLVLVSVPISIPIAVGRIAVTISVVAIPISV